MKSGVKNLARSALVGAMYAALCYLQNVLLPGSATMAIQFRAAEALCVLAFFSPAVPAGLAVGCVIFNLCWSGSLPLDAVVGGLASFLSAWSMYWLRNLRLWGIPVVGLLMPAFWNAVLVGWELSFYIGGGFWLNAWYVALGELAVLLTLGLVLYFALKRRRLDQILFG